ncbi:MAG: aldehyde ferredoxin oxidoreductase family protein [Candidatus Methanomethylicaceae archaeon]
MSYIDGGYNKKIVRIDLANEKISIEEVDDYIYRMYLGGRGLGAYFLFKELKPKIDPLSSENKLIFATGILTGVPLPGFSKYSVVSKSPLTNSFGEAEAGGFFGPELKFAGFDALIIEGKSEKPVYLWINNGKIEIRDAKHLWGKTTKDTQEEIRKELNDKLIRVASIGLAGENLVRYACIINELKYVNGRSGLGAVMGSKKLKAIAVRGHKRIKYKNEEKIRELIKWVAENWKNFPGTVARNTYGTSIGVMVNNKIGILPTKNFQGGYFEKAEEISGEKMKETILIKTEGCYACPIRCKRVVKGKEPYVTDPDYGGPEYETVAAFGSLCYIDDLNAIALANQMCNAYGLDTISTGCVIAFAMECYENNILTKNDTNGLDLKFGNKEAMLKLIEMIAKREGIGDLLAEGVMRASKKIGKGSEKFALHVKGKEVPLQEPRGKTGVGLAYALSPSGADHMQHPHDPAFEKILEEYKPLGIIKPIDSLSLGPEKVRFFMYTHLWWGLFDCLGICKFPFIPHPAGFLKINHLIEIVNAVTGWETSLWELMKVSERAINIARCFNIREGFTNIDDNLPERFFEEIKFGPKKGFKINKEEFYEAIKMYYEMMGWDRNTGIPTKAKLDELDIGWVYNEIREQ